MQPDRYAVIGNPIAHSLSPLIHHQFGEQTKQNIHYEKILAPLDGLLETLLQFEKQGGLGVNITVPFKQQAVALMQELSPRAQLANSVNTIKFRGKDQWFGDNTDGVGLVRDLLQNLHCSLQYKRILLIGAGGAANGVVAPLLEAAPQCLVIANRTKDKAENIVKRFTEEKIKACSLEELAAESAFDLIINSTSAGLKGDSLALPQTLITKNSFCYDMIYNPQATPFLLWAKENGVRQYADGLGMLVEQAAEAFLLWRGVMPKTQPVIRLIKEDIRHFSLNTVDLDYCTVIFSHNSGRL